MQSASDTIAAIATARGRAALAIVRLSGPRAIPVAASSFRGTDLEAVESHTAHVGYITSDDGKDIDQVVVTVFRNPRSVTGEDVVEIACHGGDFASQLILRRLITSGARMAEPGEFTQRAFLHGKMDLAQAEAVADLIHASSSLAHRVSLSHLQGRYSEVLQDVREELLELCAFLELELDFSEEDVVFADRDRLERLLKESESLLEELLGSYRLGAKLRDGVRVVIGGRPNAGKSTLLNALLGRDRAIVSATPGTTRDEIEDETEIEGILFRFVDTAGLRETSDAIEAEGVRRAERSIERADVLVYVYDAVRGMDDDECRLLHDAGSTLPVILVANKMDLFDGRDGAEDEARIRSERAGVEGEATGRSEERGFRDEAIGRSAKRGFRDETLALSAKLGFRDDNEIRPLVDRLLQTVVEDLSRADASPVVTNQRHRNHLEHALEAVRASHNALTEGAPGDALALDLRSALHEIGAITGEITNEDVLDQIFSRFCIGK